MKFSVLSPAAVRRSPFCNSKFYWLKKKEQQEKEKNTYKKQQQHANRKQQQQQKVTKAVTANSAEPAEGETANYWRQL